MHAYIYIDLHMIKSITYIFAMFQISVITFRLCQIKGLYSYLIHMPKKTSKTQVKPGYSTDTVK